MRKNRVLQTTDTILGGAVTITQPAEGYRVAIDPVLLAASVPVKVGQHVLDLGCGAGGVLLCLAARQPKVQYTGIEIQEEFVTLARRNIAINKIKGAEILSGDAARLPRALQNGFDHVVMNPPFHTEGKATLSPVAGKKTAHAFGADDLAAWVKSAHFALKHRALLSMIINAAQMLEALAACGGKFGGIGIFPLWPRQGQPAKRLIIRAVKNSKAPPVMHAGLVLHAGVACSAAAEKILRAPEPLLF